MPLERYKQNAVRILRGKLLPSVKRRFVEDSWGLGVHARAKGMGRTWTFGEAGGSILDEEQWDKDVEAEGA